MLHFSGCGRDNPYDIRSATRSITSLLTGIAFELFFYAVLPSVVELQPHLPGRP